MSASVFRRPPRAAIALLALGVTVLAPLAAPVAEDAAGPRFKVVLVDRGDHPMESAGAVVVRGAPETGAPQVERLTPGAAVTMTGRVMGAYEGDVPWVAIRLGDGREGYVLQSALRPPQPPEPPPPARAPDSGRATPAPPMPLAPTPESRAPESRTPEPRNHEPPRPPVSATRPEPDTPVVPTRPHTYSKGPDGSSRDERTYGAAPPEPRTYGPRTYEPGTPEPRSGTGRRPGDESAVTPPATGQGAERRAATAAPVDCRIDDKAALRGRDLSDCDLIQADLRLADLREARLSRARLSRAQLAGAWLQGADLSDATLDHADLSAAHADGAVFRRARLDDAEFMRAELTGADFEGASLRGASFGGAVLRRANLKRSDLTGSELREADAREADFSAAQVAGVYWTGTKLDGADLRGANGLDRSALALGYGVGAARTDPPPDDLKPVTEFFGKLLKPQEPR